MTILKDELYQILREHLVSGRYPEGEALPSGRRLGLLYGANKDCANSVLAALEAQGLVKRVGAKRYPVRRHRSEERVIAIEHVSHRAAHPFMSGFNQGLLDSLLSAQYGVNYFRHFSADQTPIHRGATIASLLERGILKGVLFPHWNRPSLEDLQVFREQQVAVVSLERDKMPGAIVLDVEQAALRATHYLLTSGHFPVGIVCYRGFTGRGADIRGYKQALLLSEKTDQEHIIECGNGFDDGGLLSQEVQAEPYDITQEERYARIVASGYEVLIQQIRNGDLPRGIYISDEFLAIGALRAIRESGLRIPDDVAVVSHSSANNWTFHLSGLTTMQFDAYDCGVQSGHFVVDLAEGKRPPEDRLVLQADLVKGGSCGENLRDAPSADEQARRGEAR